jgi:hypothetical protein
MLSWNTYKSMMCYDVLKYKKNPSIGLQQLIKLPTNELKENCKHNSNHVIQMSQNLHIINKMLKESA